MLSIVEFLAKKHLQKKQDIEFVDLGLPSGNLWGKCNLGATTESEPGDYYQWGSAAPVTSTVSQDNCPHHLGKKKEEGWTKYVSKYCEEFMSNPDNKLVLDPDDDPATDINPQWKTPTHKDFKELHSNTKPEVITKDGKKMLKLTSNKNKQFICLPFNGQYGRIGKENVDKEIHLWTATVLDEYPPYATSAILLYSALSFENAYRFLGYGIRPIKTSK